MLEGAAIPRRGNHHHYPDYADQSSKEVPPIRPEAVYQEAPGQRQGDKDAAVGGVGPPELGDGLQGGHYPIRCEDQTSDERPLERLVLAHPAPYEAPAADLAQPCQHKQRTDDE